MKNKQQDKIEVIKLRKTIRPPKKKTLKNKRKKKKTKLIITFSIIFSLILIGGVTSAVLLINQNNTPTKETLPAKTLVNLDNQQKALISEKVDQISKEYLIEILISLNNSLENEKTDLLQKTKTEITTKIIQELENKVNLQTKPTKIDLENEVAKLKANLEAISGVTQEISQIDLDANYLETNLNKYKYYFSQMNENNDFDLLDNEEPNLILIKEDFKRRLEEGIKKVIKLDYRQMIQLFNGPNGLNQYLSDVEKTNYDINSFSYHDLNQFYLKLKIAYENKYKSELKENLDLTSVNSNFSQLSTTLNNFSTFMDTLSGEQLPKITSFYLNKLNGNIPENSFNSYSSNEKINVIKNRIKRNVMQILFNNVPSNIDDFQNLWTRHIKYSLTKDYFSSFNSQTINDIDWIGDFSQSYFSILNVALTKIMSFINNFDNDDTTPIKESLPDSEAELKQILDDLSYAYSDSSSVDELKLKYVEKRKNDFVTIWLNTLSEFDNIDEALLNRNNSNSYYSNLSSDEQSELENTTTTIERHFDLAKKAIIENFKTNHSAPPITPLVRNTFTFNASLTNLDANHLSQYVKEYDLGLTINSTQIYIPIKIGYHFDNTLDSPTKTLIEDDLDKYGHKQAKTTFAIQLRGNRVEGNVYIFSTSSWNQWTIEITFDQQPIQESDISSEITTTNQIWTYQPNVRYRFQGQNFGEFTYSDIKGTENSKQTKSQEAGIQVNIIYDGQSYFYGTMLGRFLKGNNLLKTTIRDADHPQNFDNQDPANGKQISDFANQYKIYPYIRRTGPNDDDKIIIEYIEWVKIVHDAPDLTSANIQFIIQQEISKS